MGKERLKVIDDAVLKARAELEAEKKAQEELERLNQEAKQAMEEWEQTQPPENVVQEVIIESVDDGTKIATLVEDERQLKIPDDMFDDVKAKLQQIAEIPEEEKTDQ